MTVIVETGHIVPGANSYVTVDEYVAYAAEIGKNVDDDLAERDLIMAARFIDGHEGQLKGTRLTRDQPMAWPRRDVEIDGWWWADTEIPRQLLLAQLALALDVRAGIDLYNRPVREGQVISKRVEGAVSVAYSNPTAPMKMSKLSSSVALMNCLLRNSGLRTVSIPLTRM